MKANKHQGSNFRDYYLASIREDMIKGLGFNIRKAGISKVAAISGVSRVTIHAVLTGKKDLKLDTFIQLCMAVNLRPLLTVEVIE